MVKQFIRECDVCQRQKPDLAAYPSYIQPLPIPDKIWSSISMDFIEGLLSSQHKTVIMVVVDRMSKYAYFIALQHRFTASTIAQVFLDNVYKLHGLPESIINDRDKVFKVLKVQWLALAEFWYNTNFHTAIQTTSYEAMYGQKPPVHAPYMPGESAVEQVDRTLQAREQALNLIKYVGIGVVAYKLDLPNHGQVHPVFHVSQLKLCKGSSNKVGILPHCGPTWLISVEPIAILDMKMVKVNNKVAVDVLVKWSNHTDEDAMWELYNDLWQRFPDFKEHS
ncbi:retrotransposon-related protein [Tanacetum coccineum]